jgi:prepilin-type N-terminal cleavage/methylation domain-containing protein
MTQSPAFTLIELLIVIALIGFIGLPAITAYNRARDTQLLASEAEQMADIVRKAHIFSREIKDEKTWGVKSTDLSSYVLTSQATDGSETDVQTINLPRNISFTDTFTVWFLKGEGGMSAPTTISLKNIQGREIEIHIATTGVITVVPL